ncbi:MAG TPA: glycine cleavage system protein H [Bryobacteraceae bacterium]|nr:glycine cleavage system protein H [Bryobacteraceae bacterium]
MSQGPEKVIAYKRSRFSTRLPESRLYTRSHFWLLEEEPGIWRAGFTRFATRMLGDLVEYEFTVAGGAPVQLGQSIGWVEGFKAVSDLFSVASGEFFGSNPALLKDPTLADTDPYQHGWLYRVRGVPDPSALDVNGYIAVLDATIDKMIDTRHDGSDSNG